jgi:hypothetical protein
MSLLNIFLYLKGLSIVVIIAVFANIGDFVVANFNSISLLVIEVNLCRLNKTKAAFFAFFLLLVICSLRFSNIYLTFLLKVNFVGLFFFFTIKKT